jgi:hypothetical protein
MNQLLKFESPGKRGTSVMPPSHVHDPEFTGSVPKPKGNKRFGLLKVLAILCGLMCLLALLAPLSRSARPAARRAQCTNNLKQIALALHMYEDVHKVLPPAYTVDSSGRPLHSWRTLILPYLEQDQLYRSIDLSRPWNDPANAVALKTTIPVYRCPEPAGPGNMTTYLANAAPNGCFRPGEGRRLAEITDPHGATLLVIEAGEENAVPWMMPADADEPLVLSLGLASRLHHAGGMNAGLVDGSIRFLKASTPSKVRRALISVSGSEKLSDDEW